MIVLMAPQAGSQVGLSASAGAATAYLLLGGGGDGGGLELLRQKQCASSQVQRHARVACRAAGNISGVGSSEAPRLGHHKPPRHESNH